MDLSIVIVTYNSRAHIGACLASASGALAGLAAEICVVDNASADGTAAFVREQYPDVTVIDAPENRGFAAGVNLGLSRTTGRYVLWLNPDSRFLSGSVAAVLAWMDDHQNVGIVGGRILDPDGSVQRSVRSFPSYGAVLGARYSVLSKLLPSNPFSRQYLRADLSYEEPAIADWVSGACLLHRRSVSDAIDGVDDGFFMYFEDVDFCYRATKAGWMVMFHPGFTIEHHIGGSSEPVRFRMLIVRHHSLWRWYAKHFTRMPLKDAAVWCGVWLRCGAMMMGQMWR